MVLLRRRDAIKYLQCTGYLLSCSLTMVVHGVFLILLVLSSSYILIRAAPPNQNHFNHWSQSFTSLKEDLHQDINVQLGYLLHEEILIMS